MSERAYPAEFRRRVPELVGSGRKIADVAADLEISEQTIYTWRRQDRIDEGLELRPRVWRSARVWVRGWGT